MSRTSRVREAPEMIRNDNGELAGYIYVYLRDITGPEYVERAREYLAHEPEDSAGLLARVDRATISTPRTHVPRCGSSCR